MTYTAVDTSEQLGKPVFLYEFVQGAITWRFNSSPVDIDWNGQTWLKSSISHSNVSQSNELEKDTLTLKFSRVNQFAFQFLSMALELITSVTVRRGHLGDGNFVVYWRGRIVGGKATTATINVECESVFTSLRRPGLRARYQRFCRHTVYFSGCGLNKDTFAIAGTVSGLSGTNLTVSVASGYAAGWFLGGIIKFADQSMRMITNHSGSSLAMSRPSEYLNDSFDNAYAPGLVVTLYPGCSRDLATCTSKFNNDDNFGGFPWIPTKNPFGGSVV